MPVLATPVRRIVTVNIEYVTGYTLLTPQIVVGWNVISI